MRAPFQNALLNRSVFTFATRCNKPPSSLPDCAGGGATPSPLATSEPPLPSTEGVGNGVNVGKASGRPKSSVVLGVPSAAGSVACVDGVAGAPGVLSPSVVGVGVGVGDPPLLTMMFSTRYSS